MTFNNAINASLSSMNDASKRTSIVSGNISNTDTNGYKMIESKGQSIVNSQSGNVGGVISHTRQLIDSQGDVEKTNIATDLAIDGNGFVVVTDSFNANGNPKNIYMTRDLSFRKDATNRLVNASGYYLLAWGVDANENLPQAKSLLSSLGDVNTTQWVSEAAATTEIVFGANLRSNESVVAGGVKTIDIMNSGITGSRYNFALAPTDILYPNAANNLTQGEGLEITIGQSDGTKETKKIIYGGFAETYAFTDSANDIVAGVSGQLATDNITLQYGTNSLSVTRGAGTTNRAVLENIAFQINTNTASTDGLTARVVNLNGSSLLMISPTNISQSVTFSGNLSFRNKIGLDDSKNIASFSPDSEGVTVARFATTKQLSDALNNIGITSTLNYSESVGATITIQAMSPVAFNNYQPLGKGSDFLSEFGLKAGYLQSLYDPYNATMNMSSGNIQSHFSQNITIFDSMGNQQNLMVAFLKKDVNRWAIEVYANDKQSVNIPGRTDGLLMAGEVVFDGKGHFSSIQPCTQYAYTENMGSMSGPLGATAGQTLTVNVGVTAHTFTYGSMIATTSNVSGAGTGYTGTATDTLDITVGSTTYNIARGNGANNLVVLQNIADQINATSGSDAAIAQIIYDPLLLQYHMNIRAADKTKSVSFGQTGTVGTNLGITSANNIAENSFESLAELAAQINETTGPNAIHAEVVPGSTKNTYQLRINPVNSNFYVTFGGTTSTIAAPLGTGSVDSIANALGLQDTSEARMLTGIDQALNINWSNVIGANPSNIKFDWGSFGGTDGLGQVSGNYSVKKSDQNGISTGNLTGIQIDQDGWIIAAFSNSMTRKIYKIPLGDFANPNGLVALPGNVYMIGINSGPMNLKEAGMDGAGRFVSGALEGSNVDIAGELTKLIFAQRQYQASSKVINIVDKLLEDLVHRTFN
ncbi:MAG: flagellar hook-basal body complex protein [Alphaproteobacteria bacterium]|nr:flagellar hook-basal body complex protein [Candidatus Jidaibacter sp.]